MTTPVTIEFANFSLENIAETAGRLVIFVTEDGKLDQSARKVNSLTKKAVERLVDSDGFEKMSVGDVTTLAYPAGVAADAVLVVKLPRRPSQSEARKAGAAIAKAMGSGNVTLLAGQVFKAEEVAFGIAMRAYAYTECKTSDAPEYGTISVMVKDVDAAKEAYAPLSAVVEGVFFTRDLTSAPANVLTTTTFAEKLKYLSGLGVEVEVLEEAQLEELGMGSLLCVGQGSDSPSKVVVMKWNGGGDEAPFAFVGKGVVFDTGGISLKPAAGMEDMTMDMGGAGVVSGVMKTLALRKAKANVVGLVGLVENMPSGNATRPGDIVKSMKGDTIEVINTDAEGRLVLADVLWYTQERFNPSGIVNLATLTGAIIIALGNENAGVFSNDDTLAANVVGSAAAEGEGAWRMPMGPAYDKLIKSNKADMKNTGGRAGGSITAAQFLKRFIKDDMPWAHIDIAGTADTKTETALAPKGATGWGVMALNRLIADKYEA
ncbi:leucyl aminopeptidase [Marivivens niveibacter]|uniref:Probable cytosol aminopeptidase n=1 Tax=Marivivens niveibacter TaxID=1930667 RepID=A0A251X393_9RHOB|nr:leucyl aminopeptidase [Marivivens niveibacter]OUD11051.1 leucyl aminopeptidase [Marivivens niveibacter]